MMKVLLLTVVVMAAVLSASGQRDRRGLFGRGGLFGGRPHPILDTISHIFGGGDSSPRGRDRAAGDRPNVILMVADDMGVGDLTSYGHPVQEPGFIDEMAAKGMRFTNGYVGDSVCTPSRSAIMTGRLPIRIGTYGETRVFLPWTTTGLPKDEMTIAEVMQQADYATGMVGKWHLGINENTNTDGNHLPVNHGFDFVGHNLPFTNSWACDDTGLHLEFPNTKACYLYFNDQLLTQPYQHNGLTQLFTGDAVQFIEDNQDDPFFLYFAYAHMHTSLFSSDEFACTSRRGRYGDNLLEMHSSVEEVTQKLVDLGIDDNTIIFFISDHGPHREYCEEGGDANIFRGGKSLSWEGGHRIPYIVYWPGMVESGISNEIVTSMDVIATAADLAGTSLPTDRIYDGKSIKEVILNGGESPHEAFFYYCKDTMMAVRVGQYKAHYRTQRVFDQHEYGEKCDGGFPINDYFDCNECDGDCVTIHDVPILYDLFQDPGEAYPLDVKDYPSVMDDIADAVKDHNSVMVKGESLLDSFNMDITPCCDEATDCICNYTQNPVLPVCYQYLYEIAARNYDFI